MTQSAHVSMLFLTRRFLKNPNGTFILNITEAEQEWLDNSYAKITCKVDNETALLELCDQAQKAGLECQLVIDEGRTQFKGVPTITCCAIGPDYSEKIDPITRHLKLY